MFFVNYDSNGNINSYSSGPDASENVCPDNCQTLTFASDIPGFINSNGTCLMKVDVDNKVLVLINPQTIPAPIGG